MYQHYNIVWYSKVQYSMIYKSTVQYYVDCVFDFCQCLNTMQVKVYCCHRHLCCCTHDIMTDGGHEGHVSFWVHSSLHIQMTPSPPLPVSLSLEDSELLSFYSSQSLAHLSCLADAIDVLFSSVQGNQPPRIFVARGKSLIVTAHKLVFISDTLSRLLTSTDLRTKVCRRALMWGLSENMRLANVSNTFFCLFLPRSRPQGGDSARLWRQSWWQPRVLPRTTPPCQPPRRWWTMWLNFPSRPPASPLCSNVWQKSPHDIWCHFYRKAFKHSTLVHSEMPYLWLVSLISSDWMVIDLLRSCESAGSGLWWFFYGWSVCCF